jgi:SAM-dependent methyltransferase
MLTKGMKPMLLAQPYSQFVAAYDRMVGDEFFLRLRRSFETLVARYGIRFGSAADIGCGTGQFACYLNRCWSVPVFAVDKSREMLCAARRRCRGPGVSFLRQDIRNLCLPRPVDLVTANFDTMNHLVAVSDLRRACRRVARNLRPGGHFYFDLVTPCRPLNGLRAYRRAHCTAFQSLEQRVRWEPADRLIHIQVVHRRADCPHPVLERHLERAYGPGAAGRELFDAGFIVRGVHNEETLEPADHCPPRLVIVAQKSNQE